MILGVGIDLAEVARIRVSLQRFGDRFRQRILTAGEIAYCGQFKEPSPHVAVRFAAKEAMSKAFGTGIGTAFGWHDLEVGRKESGEPFAILHGPAEALRKQRGGRIWLSLTHTAHYATAVAILESAPDQRA
jgi:holo-[acyl-carrier protein] synthase